MVEVRKCSYCGKEFKPAKKTRQFCSRVCVGNYRKGLNLHKQKEKKCALCGKTFIADIHNKTYCSNECKAEMKRCDKSKITPKKKKKTKVKSIAEMQKEARMHGMTYGQYVEQMEMQKGVSL